MLCPLQAFAECDESDFVLLLFCGIVLPLLVTKNVLGVVTMASKKMINVLKTISLLEQTPSVGEGREDKKPVIKASDISFWSNCNRMTTWRALRRLEGLGLVTKTVVPYKNTVMNLYGTTELGKQFYLHQKEMYS